MSHPEPSDLSPLARAGIVAVAAVAAVLSFSALRQLAIVCDTWTKLAWLFPLSLDAAAAFGTLIWLRARRVEVARLAQRLTFATIALSILGNATWHGFGAVHLVPPWPVAVVVGAIPPAVFGAVVHLAVTATGSAVVQVDQVAGPDQPGQVDQVAGPDQPDRVAVDQADRTGLTDADRVRALHVADPELSQRKISERLTAELGRTVSRRAVRDALELHLQSVS